MTETCQPGPEPDYKAIVAELAVFVEMLAGGLESTIALLLVEDNPGLAQTLLNARKSTATIIGRLEQIQKGLEEVSQQ